MEAVDMDEGDRRTRDELIAAAKLRGERAARRAAEATERVRQLQQYRDDVHHGGAARPAADERSAARAAELARESRERAAQAHRGAAVAHDLAASAHDHAAELLPERAAEHRREAERHRAAAAQERRSAALAQTDGTPGDD